MAIGDFVAFILVAPMAVMIWASLQTVPGDSRKAYEKINENLWAETKVPGSRKPRFPKLWEPVLPPKKED